MKIDQNFGFAGRRRLFVLTFMVYVVILTTIAECCRERRTQTEQNLS